ncbi:MAG: coproporphyrinogen dehydrogenase HemZ [Clostridiales bacterium]|nr:coproporphyrinogen dehydrogenase HemZ [Clostridiales bacterium]
MITVELNKADFEYDIHSLVKAFYPEHEVLVRAVREEEPERPVGACGSGHGDPALRAGLAELGNKNMGLRDPDAAFHLAVVYGEADIGFTFFCERRGEEDNDSPSFRGTQEKAFRGSVSVDFSDRITAKNRLKKKLYEMLASFSGRTLPWGTLTGIRPTKIPYAMLEEGKTDDEIRAYMRETYFASEEKIDLSIGIAKRERELLSRIDYEDGYSLYIGIPFCPSTCLYCSFTSYPIQSWKNRTDEYLDALCREISRTAQMCRDKYLNSVYIGGGTPTSLEPEQLERLITHIGESFRLMDADGRIVYGGLERDVGRQSTDRPDCDITGWDAEWLGTKRNEDHSDDDRNHLLEFTVEAGRPDSITAEKLAVLKRHNISRISINPQTMKEETLRLIGRQHTVEQTRQSFSLAREMGFDNINMDLIAGLPEENPDDVRRTMEEITKLRPDNVTVHSLAVKRASRLRIEREQYGHLHMENTWETIRLTADACRRMGLEPYYLYRQKNMAGNFENVGYAAPGKAGIYNILIMEEKQTIMALGAGATSKVVYDHGNRIERVGNVKDITNYLERVDEMIERKRKLLEKIKGE